MDIGYHRLVVSHAAAVHTRLLVEAINLATYRFEAPRLVGKSNDRERRRNDMAPKMVHASGQVFRYSVARGKSAIRMRGM